MAADRDETGQPSERDLATLRHIAAEEVTWRSDVSGRTSFRLWSDERAYTVCTPAAKRVIGRGWAKAHHGYVHGRGEVALTDLGRAVLAAHIGSTEGASDGD